MTRQAHPRRFRSFLWLALALTLLLLTACRERAAQRAAQERAAPAAQQTPAPPSAEPPSAEPADTEEPPQPLPVAPAGELQIVTEEGGRLDWSSTHNLIVFDRPDGEGLYQIWTITPQGQNESCLTCNQPDAPPHHKGNPSWHPSGDYIVFQASGESGGLLGGMATPGMGRNNNVWLMSRDGSRYFQLTEVAEGMGVLHPHFSEDGTKLVWAEKLEAMRPLRGEAEEWSLRVADFRGDDSGFRLENVQTYQPLGPVFYESHGFSPDGSRILFTAFLQPDETTGSWMDIYTLELASGAVARLTDSPAVWDEHAHFSPDGSRIVWASSTDCQCDPSRLRTLQMDLWFMQADGVGKSRLTNLVGSGGSRTLAVDNAWGPDGRQVAVLLVDGNAPRVGSIAVVTLP